jgi:hypothetical protein
MRNINISRYTIRILDYSKYDRFIPNRVETIYDQPAKMNEPKQALLAEPCSRLCNRGCTVYSVLAVCRSQNMLGRFGQPALFENRSARVVSFSCLQSFCLRLVQSHDSVPNAALPAVVYRPRYVHF